MFAISGSCSLTILTCLMCLNAVFENCTRDGGIVTSWVGQSLQSNLELRYFIYKNDRSLQISSLVIPRSAVVESRPSQCESWVLACQVRDRVTGIRVRDRVTSSESESPYGKVCTKKLEFTNDQFFTDFYTLLLCIIIVIGVITRGARGALAPYFFLDLKNEQKKN